MDYQRHYDQLISRAKERTLSGYVEIHHIVPKCIGGRDEKSNLVQLTAEEHYLAHQLLHKVHPTIKGLAFAMKLMTGGKSNRSGNKCYGWIRRKCAVASSEQTKDLWESPIYRAAVSKAISILHKGRVKSQQERANIAEAGRNRVPRKFSEQAKKNMAEARKKTWAQRKESGEDKLIAAKIRGTRIANGSYNFTEEHRKAIGEAGKGRVPWNKGKKLKAI